MVRETTEREREMDGNLDEVTNAASKFMPYAFGTAIVIVQVGVAFFFWLKAFGN